MGLALTLTGSCLLVLRYASTAFITAYRLLSDSSQSDTDSPCLDSTRHNACRVKNLGVLKCQGMCIDKRHQGWNKRGALSYMYGLQKASFVVRDASAIEEHLVLAVHFRLKWRSVP